MLLPDPPRAAACLPKRVERVARFVEVERRKGQEIETCLHQPWMADDNLDAGAKLPLIPRLPLVGGNRGTKHRNTKALLLEDLLQATGNVVLAREGGVDLAPPPLAQLLTDILDEAPLLGIRFGLR